MLLHHLGDGTRHGLLLRAQALVKVHSQVVLQEVDDELRSRHLLLVVLYPGHLTLWGELPVEVILEREEERTF